MTVLVVALFAALPAAPGEAVTPRRYALEQRKVSDQLTYLRLYNRRTGRTIWTRSVVQVDRVAWSPDGTAVAIVDDRAGVWSHPWYFRLIYWRVGQRVQVRDDLQPLKRFEGLMDLSWSPDNRRLLLLGGLSMGSLDVGSGDLWCFDTRLDRSGVLAAKQDIAEAEWVSPTLVRVRTRVLRIEENGASILKERTHTLDARRLRKPGGESNYAPGR